VAWTLCLSLITSVAAPADVIHGSNVKVEEVAPDQYKVTMRYPAENIERLFLVGDFNEWALFDTPLYRDGDFYQIELVLNGGKYAYKYYANEGEWRLDEQNPVRESDGAGGQQSILKLGYLAQVGESRARERDGRVVEDVVLHIPELPLYQYMASAGDFRLRVITMAKDVEKVELMRPTAGGLSWGTYKTERIHRDSRFDYYEASIQVEEGEKLNYAFKITDGLQNLTLDASGVYTAQGDPKMPFIKTVSRELLIDTPAWASEVTWYHVLIDRFRNGTERNDPPNTHSWTSEWSSPAAWEGQNSETFYNRYVFDRFYGGDLQGLREKLMYLHLLGVNGINLSPVFVATTYTGADVVDFRHVDDRFGVAKEWAESKKAEDLLDPETWEFNESDREFLEFIKEAHQRGMKVMLDLPMASVGALHLAAVDLQSNKRNSAYFDWFEMENPAQAKVKVLDKNNTRVAIKMNQYGPESLTYQKHLLDITRRWMDPNGDGNPSDGVDGWRVLDAANVPHPFFQQWRAFCKSINPDVLLVCETRSQPDSYLGGQEFDAAANYPLARLIHDFVGNQGTSQQVSAQKFREQIDELLLRFPNRFSTAMLNLVNSMGTDRLLSMMENSGRQYDRGNELQRDGASYNDNKPGEKARAKARLALVLQVFLTGAPVHFYGTEAGMFGADVPNNHRPMVWDDLGDYEDEGVEVSEDCLEFLRRLNSIRNTWKVFQTGEYVGRHHDNANGTFAFSLQGDTEAALVFVNVSEKPQSIRVDVKGLTDSVGPVKSWMELLNSPDPVFLNIRSDDGRFSRRGIRFNDPHLYRTRVDEAIEVQLEPKQAAIYVSAGI
jgi:glycosidase